MWPIVRDSLAGASEPIRHQIRWIAAFWALMVVLQMWDSRDGRGAAGLAEFLSAILGVSGIALLGLAYTLNLTMQEAGARGQSVHDAASVQQVLLALPAVGFAAGVSLGCAAILMLLRAMLGAEMLFALAGLTLYSGFLVIAGRTAMQSARMLFRHAGESAAAAAQARGEATSAQFAALQARMNPHFLFNALNTVASLVRSDPPAAERVVENLSEVLRRTLERSSEVISTVEDEVEYVRAYLALEQERCGERLRVVWDIDENARLRPLPPLVLQPLVENALRHGLGGRIEGGEIHIAVRANQDDVAVTVEDDGAGFPPGWHERDGLGNLRQRLRTLYGEDALLQIDSRRPGTSVTVIVPARRP